MINLTQDQLQQCLPTNKHIDVWYPQVMAVLPIHNIDSTKRVAAFLAQCGHESLDFNILEENLNYGAAGLLKIFPSHFNATSAANAARKPQTIANIIYANRMGNGDTASGDGWNFRGRGLIQVTGKSNYEACSTALFNDDSLIQNPGTLTTQKGALESACWFWDRNRLNQYADADNMRTLTQRINGGTVGLNERIERYQHCLNVLQ